MRLIPILIPYKDLGAVAHDDFWYNPADFFGGGMVHYKTPVIACYRSSKLRPNLQFPIRFHFLNAHRSGKDFVMDYSDNNDVIPNHETANTFFPQGCPERSDIDRALSNACRMRDRNDARETFMYSLVNAMVDWCKTNGADIFNSGEGIFFGPHYASLEYTLPYSDTLAQTLGEDRMRHMRATLGPVEGDKFLPMTDIGLARMSGHHRMAADTWDVAAITRLNAHKRTPVSQLF